MENIENIEFTEHTENAIALDELFNDSETVAFPCVPTRGIVLYPNMTLNFEVGREKSIYSIKKSIAEGSFIFIVSQTDNNIDDPQLSDINPIGTIASIVQLVEIKGGTYRCLVEGISRAELIDFSSEDNGFEATVFRMNDYEPEVFSEEELEALKRKLKDELADYISYLPNPPQDEFADDIFLLEDPKELFEGVAFNIPLSPAQRQELLELGSAGEKLEKLLIFLARETDILKLETKISDKVHSAVNQNQRDFYIREQIHALQEELGETPDMQGDTEEVDLYREKLAAISNISEDARSKISEEIDRLAKMPSFSQEAALIRSYLDTCLSLPWDSKSEETADVEAAQRILDEDHYGIKKVKDRILENIAVRALTPDVKGQIICLSGPPGVGKTSLAKSIARALGRKYVRISLGGVRDESDIRGHRKTYLGAMPGRIIAALKQAGTSNPVMLLDEIDKMANDFRGDPSSAMLEVLDSEQNSQFRDHYTEIPFDLSDVLFITTANNTSLIAPPLLDRMELIELSSYTREEKFHIAKEHLIPKQMKKYGIDESMMRITDGAIYTLIDSYTKESGVRKLEREIASLCRKAAKQIVSGENKVLFKANNLEKYLGNKKYLDDYFVSKPCVGCVNGLAWTSVGGVIMPLEVLVLDGKGKIEVTGSLGDVMKESAKLAVSNARRLAKTYGISSDFYEKKDIHIHAPEGAVPKDGPSAGVTMTTAIISALSGIKVRSDVAMTGEITLTGKVLPIGGLKEKTMAAYKSGVKTVIIPKANKPDLDEVDDIVKQSVEFITADRIEDVLAAALIKNESPRPAANRGRKPKTVRTTEAI
ncbi:MAG: endopeptidase La [Oscillospiraceae bacterium]